MALEGQEIEALLNHTITVREARENELKKDKNAYIKEYKAEYYPNYNYMVRLYDAVRMHFDNRVVPMQLFENRSPNQTDKEAKWLKANYKLITGPVAMDYVNTVGRCFIQGNFNISYKAEDDDFVNTETTYEQYVTKEYGQYGSLMNYARNFLPTIKAQDANGVIAVRPKDIPLVENEDGELVVSGVDLPEPLPYYYDINRVVGYKDGVYAMIETPEKSIVIIDKKPVKDGYIYELYDDQWIYRIIQVGKKEDNEYNVIPWFEHEAGEVPVIKLMGVAGIDDNQIIYQSPFMLGTALLEEAILDNGYLQMIKAKVVFPHKITLASQCEYEEITEAYNAKCSGGYLKGHTVEGDEYNKICPKCNGQGMISRMAPFGEMLIAPPDQFNPAGDKDITEPIKFVAPPLDAPKMLREEVENNINKARGLLHLNTTMGEAKGREDATATAKALDLKNLISFVAPPSGQTWQIVRFLFKMTGIMRYKNRFNMPDIIEPKDFDFKTQSDYLADIKEASESGNVPYPVIAELLRMYIKSAFHGENSSIKVLNLLTDADKLLTASQEDIDMGASRGEIEPWQIILHRSGLSFVSELVRDNPDFLELPLSDQVEQLEAVAREAAESARNAQAPIAPPIDV